mmetsp:Transcript_8778/g.33130  ORF Transcript_8778/g.33130 Transcript_8778/m.33130 type:complete len:141 (-) Transcript_8778:223-645(-)
MLEECLVFELPERGYKLKTSERTREKRVKEEEQRGDLETQARLKHLGRQAHQSCPPQTFRDVFKKYYDDNYRNALFSRMKKDVIRATDANSDGFISEEELRALLGNIGANMEENDIKAVMSLGNSDGKGIPNTTFLKLLD